MDNSNRIDELQTALTTAIRINEFLMAENDLLRKKDFTPCSKKPPEEDGCYLVYAPNYSGGSSSSKEIHDGVMFSNYKNGCRYQNMEEIFYDSQTADRKT